jgi:hypothetical protein
MVSILGIDNKSSAAAMSAAGAEGLALQIDVIVGLEAETGCLY